jgi:hypothetical protein
MKKPVVVFLVVACAAALVPGALEAGVWFKGGFSLAMIHQTATEPLLFTWGNLPFFAGGLAFEGRWGLVSLQPEVLYIRTGGRYTIDVDNDLEYRFNTLQVPVLLKLNAVPSGPVCPFIAGGVYGSYLIRAQGVITADGVTSKENLTVDYLRFDFGVVAGAGLTFRRPGFSISVEGRYNYGLANIMKDPPPGEAIKTRCLLALLGISY